MDIFDDESLSQVSPWVFSKPEGLIMTIVCPNTGKIVKKTWRQSENWKLREICQKNKEKLRIAYNNVMPYFDLKNGKADMDTLEGFVLQLLLDNHNIEPVYMNGDYEWGSIDPETGLWNGVVGMVGRIVILDISISLLGWVWFQ